MRQLTARRKFVMAIGKGARYALPELIGNAVVISERCIREEMLVTAPVYQFADWIKHPDEEFTRDLPGVSENDLGSLDDTGLVNLGTPMAKNAVLIGKVRHHGEPQTAEETLLRSIFGGVAARTVSTTYPFRDPGIVTHRHRDTQRTRAETVVEVQIRRPLAIGDELVTDGGDRLLIARTLPENEMPKINGEYVDILISPDCSVVSILGTLEGKLYSVTSDRKADFKGGKKSRGGIVWLTKTTRHCEEKAIAVSLSCPKSLVTKQPISTEPFSGVDKVKLEDARALAVAGYPENVREIMCAKSDFSDLSAIYKSLARHATNPSGLDLRPTSLTRLSVLLRGLALQPNFGEVELTFRPVPSDEIVKTSFGEVTEPETINYRTMRPEKGGLLCERIFGPDRDYECGCGKYRGTKFKKIVCDRCGVMVTRREVRRERFGHISLTVPVVHPLFYSHLPEILGMDEATVRDIVYYRNEYGTPGAQGIADLLQKKGIDPSLYILETLPVIPPDWRPVQLEDQMVTSTDLNELYRRVINRNTRAAKLRRVNAAQVVQHNEAWLLQRGVDECMMNRQVEKPVLGTNGKPLRGLSAMFADAVSQHATKKVACCARGMAIPDSGIPAGTIGVPHHIARTLYEVFVIGILRTNGTCDTVKSAERYIHRDPTAEPVVTALQQAMAERKTLVLSDTHRTAVLEPRLTDGESMTLHPEDARQLGVTFTGERVHLHVPLSAEAQAELEDPCPLPDTSSEVARLTTSSVVAATLKRQAIKLTEFDKLLLGRPWTPEVV